MFSLKKAPIHTKTYNDNIAPLNIITNMSDETKITKNEKKPKKSFLSYLKPNVILKSLNITWISLFIFLWLYIKVFNLQLPHGFYSLDYQYNIIDNYELVAYLLGIINAVKASLILQSIHETKDTSLKKPLKNQYNRVIYYALITTILLTIPDFFIVTSSTLSTL
jgi:hypothetical protein